MEKLGSLIDKGNKALAQRQYEEAGTLFESVVTRAPKSHAGWFGLGEVALAIGQQDSAVTFLEEAVKLKPDKVKYLHRLGDLYRNIGLSKASVEVLLAARRKAPKDKGVLASLSSSYAAADNWPKAKEVAQQLLDLPGRQAAYYCLLGLAAQGAGELEEATQALTKATKKDPSYLDAWISLGYLHLGKFQLGKNEEDRNHRLELVEHCLEKLFQLAPRQTSTLELAGDLAMERENFTDAANLYRVAAESASASKLLLAKLCLALTQGGGSVGEAIDVMQRAVECGVPEAMILDQLGLIFTRRYQLDAAQENLEMSLEREPENLNCMNTLLVVYCKQGKAAQAEELAKKILEKDPRHLNALINLGGLYSEQGQTEKALETFSRALEIGPDYQAVYTNLLWGILHSSERSASDVLAVGRAFDRNVCQKLRHEDRFADRDRNPERRLKIGWLTSDMRQHPVAAFVGPLLSEFDRQQLELFMYHNTRSEDNVTAYAKLHVDKWREVQGLGDEALAKLIRADEIDILVDLNGNTENHRLLAVARKPAPIQITWLGYPGTTGMSSVDYIFIPPDPVLEEGKWCSETPWPLPDCYGVRNSDTLSPVPIQPGLPCERLSRPFSFACLNNFRKASNKAVELWSRILNAVPDSRLILVGRAGRDESFQDFVKSQFTAHGVDPARLDIRGMTGRSIYFDWYNEVDLGLDPFPFNGGTASYDSIWMGVPFVTLPGDMLASRMGRAILRNVGLSELVAESADDYVDIAVSLANDHARLLRLRDGLHERMQASPLMDAPRMARNLTTAFREMWRRWCSADTGMEPS